MTMNRREKEKQKRKRQTAAEWSKGQESKGSSTVKLPNGIKQYKLEEGTHKFDIMPYISGEGDPKCEPGTEMFDREHEVYRVPVPGGDEGQFDRFVSPASFGEFDYVQQWRNKEASEAEAKAIYPQKRHLFLINDRPGDAKNPLKVLDAVHFNRKLGFGEQLKRAIDSEMAKQGEDFFLAGLEDGMTVMVTVESSKFGSVSRVDLLPRKHKYPESLLDDAPCLDDCLVRPDKDEVMHILTGRGHVGTADELRESVGKSGRGSASRNGDDSDDDEDDTPSPKKGKKKELTAEEAGIEVGDNVEYNHEDGPVLCEVFHISGDDTSLKLRDEDGNTYVGVGVDEVEKVEASEDMEEDDEDDTPPPKKDKKPPVDEDEDEDEDEPAPKKQLAKSEKKAQAPTKKKPWEDDEDEPEDSDEDDDPDEDEDEPDEDDDDDDEPAVKKKPAGKRK